MNSSHPGNIKNDNFELNLQRLQPFFPALLSPLASHRRLMKILCTHVDALACQVCFLKIHLAAILIHV
jgi:hypothetical protein